MPEIACTATVPFSFELYPARTPEGAPAVAETARRLAAANPAFVSVTYGAAGSSTGRSLGLVQTIGRETTVPAVAHLTCVGATRAQLVERVEDFLAAGALRFLALRGDVVATAPAAEVGSAAELIGLIRETAAAHGLRPEIGVAAFPNGHPNARDPRGDLAALRAKQEAGADFALTQVIFDAADYARFVADARAAGVTMPIIPGLMPVSSTARIERVAELTGELAPAELALDLGLETDAAARERIAVAFTARLARDLIAAGAPALHLYAFNRHDTVLAVLREAGLLSRSATVATPTPPNPPGRSTVIAPPTPPAPSVRITPQGDTMTAFPAGTILGYPRLGPRRELKHALEAHWAGTLDETGLEHTARELRRRTRARLVELGLNAHDSSIPETSSYYDQVLDAAVAVGAVPDRFADVVRADGTIGLDGYFALARGDKRRPALELTKWFDTNYHYLVPELAPGHRFHLADDRLVRHVAEARAEGFTVRPSIVGPVTLLALAKPAEGAPAGFFPLDLIDAVVPVYAELLARLRSAGAEWVQLDEPALVAETLPVSARELADATTRAYAALGAAAGRPRLLVTTSYAQPLAEAWQALAAAPVEAISVDLVRGALPEAHPGLAGKTLVAGVVDGRNVWRGDLAAALETLGGAAALGADTVAVGTSTSLQHLPHDIADEPDLDPRLKSWLAFADQRVGQVAALARGLAEGSGAIAADLADAAAALADRESAPGVRISAVRDRTGSLSAAAFRRDAGSERAEAQADALRLPVLPTTTIGSFPQTDELRRARSRHARGELTTAEYEELLRLEITTVIGLQEELGLDVLVHGEPERNDMVQYFAEHLDGFVVTRHGWVQSYGSRATRPSILWGDVTRPAPITVRWSSFAQSLTGKPVKGMLTGPVTILAWSFVRDDQPLAETANQVALALRDEIADLEASGIRIVQVDEPALRELLPLAKAAQPAYLDWSVASFRLATGGAGASTQVHTHLCYSEFGVVIDAIAGLDADVTSIEAARSRGEVIADLAASGFDRGIGPGVYDIHSPRVPSVAEVVELLERAVDELSLRSVWVNPDCGLKTRRYPETVASLANLVEATRKVRDRATALV